MRRGFGPLAAVLALAAGASAPAFAASAYSFYGTNTNGRTFNRPTVGSPTLSGKIVAYSSQPFFVSAAATCRIQSVQEGSFDGVIYLYQGAFDPASPLTNLVASSDNNPVLGFSEIPSVALAASQNYYLVSTSNEPGIFGNFSSQVACTGTAKILVGDGTLPANDGRYGELRNGRFRVSATWRNFQGQSGHATFVPLGSEETGVLWFFNPANFEVMLKVIDGCGLNNRYWVFFAALTNVEFHITVRDTWANVEKTYDNALGVSAPAVTDSSFFQTCP
jgi:hypothetical protein